MYLERLSKAGAVIACLLTAIAIPASAHAQLGLEARLQMGFGGDRLGTVEYSDGSESDLKLGQYFTIAAGPIFQAWSSGASEIELQAMAGFSHWSTGPQNTDDRLKISHIPLEAMAFYGHRIRPITTLRVGGGVTYHINGSMSGSGSLEGTEADIENALGAMGDVSVIWGAITAGVRYKYIKPKFEGATTSLNGSSFGVYFGFTTPRK